MFWLTLSCAQAQSKTSQSFSASLRDFPLRWSTLNALSAPPDVAGQPACPPALPPAYPPTASSPPREPARRAACLPAFPPVCLQPVSNKSSHIFFQTPGLRVLACVHFLRKCWIYYGLSHES